MLLGRAVFVLLPLLSATQLCEDGPCERSGTPRIFEGGITEQNSRPFQVALYLRVGTTGQLGFCGGALVHPQWVLTAAHCCYHGEQLVDNVQAIFGAHSLYDRYENGRRIVNVEELVVHSGWNPDTFANDLALLRLANTLQLTETINVVRLPYLSVSSFNFAGQGSTVSGWGIAAQGVTFVSPTLREKLMTVMTDPLCNSSYLNLLPDNTVCGFSSTGGTCKGDNGGPLTIFFNSTEETLLIGIASFVDAGGCNNDLPSVFTRVQRYLTWISAVGLRLPPEGRIPLAAKIKEQEDGILLHRQLGERIVGGATAPTNAYPFLAGLLISFVNVAGQSACGSSLLSSTRLVTAAHCWFDGVNQGSSYTVVLGSPFLYYGGIRIVTSSVVMHPLWNPSTLHNDIAMIYLPTPVAFTASIQPISLPSWNDLSDQFTGEWALAAGYGVTSDQQTSVSQSATVMHVNLQVITVAQCQVSFGFYVQPTTICTNGAGGVGICRGDSGGPLIINRNGQSILVGVSSFVAQNQCTAGHPSAFARITSFYSFIIQHML